MTDFPADRTALRSALEGWAGRNMPSGGVRITDVARAEGGRSSETWLVDALIGPAAVAARWVLRVEPRGHQIYENPSVERQFRMIRALSEQGGLPAPAAIAFEPDPTLLGAPFFLMERAEGEAPPGDYHNSGVLAQAGPAAREAMWREGIGLLAKLHALDPAPFGFLAFGSGDGVAQELARWDSYRRWCGVPQSALLDRARLWLEDHRPPPAPVGVAWGDARLCNLLFDRGRCTAILDWETASLGGAESDLGWWIFYDEMVAEAAGAPRLPGIGDRAATIALWEEHAGRPAQAMEWHLIFAAWRFALISERAVALSVAAGRPPATVTPRDNPAVRRLEALLDET
jgi:aminoglycoside phosphotransferase (APT) family kinase protein